MNDAFLEKLTKWAHEDPTDEIAQSNLRAAGAAAESYLRAADVPMDPTEEDRPLWEIAILKLALYFYDQRGADARYGYVALPPDLNALVNSLRNGGTSA